MEIVPEAVYSREKDNLLAELLPMPRVVQLISQVNKKGQIDYLKKDQILKKGQIDPVVFLPLVKRNTDKI